MQFSTLDSSNTWVTVASFLGDLIDTTWVSNSHCSPVTDCFKNLCGRSTNIAALLLLLVSVHTTLSTTALPDMETGTLRDRPPMTRTQCNAFPPFSHSHSRSVRLHAQLSRTMLWAETSNWTSVFEFTEQQTIKLLSPQWSAQTKTELMMSLYLITFSLFY